jgi:predicted nucleotidyltransferase
MGDRDEPKSATDHAAAAEAFTDRIQARFSDEIEGLYVFGSTVRGDASGLASDVDVLVVLSDDSEHERVTDELRDVAYDVMLAFGPVVELHIFTEREFDSHLRRGNPFVENALSEGESYA